MPRSSSFFLNFFSSFFPSPTPSDATYHRANPQAAQDDGEKIRTLGLSYMTDLARSVLASGAPGLYLYSLNLEKSVKELVKAIDLSASLSSPRPLPWARARDSERVRYGPAVVLRAS
eukprot:519575-Rhodomonas_salina.1